MQPIIAYLWQINFPTPLKWFWVALTLANVAMMLCLACRERAEMSWFMVASAAASIFQKSPVWGIWGENLLMVAGAAFVGALTRQIPGKMYALLMACAFLGALIWTIPTPRPGYPQDMFHVRLYSSMAYFAMLAGAMTWEWERPRAEMVIAALWFVPPMIASASVNWEVSWWGVQVANTGIWTACLCGWMTIKGKLPTTGNRESTATAPESPAARS